MVVKPWNQMSTEEKLGMLHDSIDLLLTEVERFKHVERGMAVEIDNVKGGLKAVSTRVLEIEGRVKKKG